MALWGRLESDCIRCHTVEVPRSLIEDFAHDLRCWGITTALCNLWYRLTQKDDE